MGARVLKRPLWMVLVKYGSFLVPKSSVLHSGSKSRRLAYIRWMLHCEFLILYVREITDWMDSEPKELGKKIS